MVSSQASLDEVALRMVHCVVPRGTEQPASVNMRDIHGWLQGGTALPGLGDAAELQMSPGSNVCHETVVTGTTQISLEFHEDGFVFLPPDAAQLLRASPETPSRRRAQLQP